MSLLNDQITAKNFKEFYETILPYLGGGSGGSSVHYSTDEQVIGTWIDGKSIYQKTWTFTNTMTVSESSWANTGIEIDIARCISCVGFDDSGQCVPLIAGLYSNPTRIALANSSTLVRDIKGITLQYTKTTD